MLLVYSINFRKDTKVYKINNKKPMFAQKCEKTLKALNIFALRKQKKPPVREACAQNRMGREGREVVFLYC